MTISYISAPGSKGPDTQAENDRAVQSIKDSFYNSMSGIKRPASNIKSSALGPLLGDNETPKTASVDTAPEKQPKATTKSAALIGGPNTSELEVGLGQVAESHINNKAPLLRKFMLGFQLLKKTDDDTKACGIFAYKLGDELVYIPVFVIDGSVQGHEMMYVVSKDQFVPSDEKWVNFLLSRKPLEPGQAENRPRSEIHTQGTYRPTHFSSGMKLSSVDIPKLPYPLVQDALRCLFKTASVGTPGLQRTFWGLIQEGTDRIPMVSLKKAAFAPMDVKDLFRKSAKSVKLAAAWSRDYPVFGRLLDYVMDGEDIGVYTREWEKRAAYAKSIGLKATPRKLETFSEKLAALMPTKAVVKEDPGYVAVYGLDKIASHQFKFMDADLVDKIHANGYYVTDTRDQTKLAAIMDDERDMSTGACAGLCNPTGPGLYKVFMADGTFTDRLVLDRFKPRAVNSCDCHDPDEKMLLDINTREVVHAPNNRIWVSGPPSEHWFSKVPDSNDSVSDDSRPPWSCESMLISSCGQVYLGDFVDEGNGVYKDERAGATVVVRGKGIKGFRLMTSGVDGVSPRNSCNAKLVVTDEDTKLRCYSYKDAYSGDGKPLGTFSLWLTLLMDHTCPISVSRGSRTFKEYVIDDEPVKVKSAALESLMVKHHLDQSTAEWFLKAADDAYPRPVMRRRQKVATAVSQDRFSVTFPERDYSTEPVTGLSLQHDLETEDIVDILRMDHDNDPETSGPRMPDAETSRSWGPSEPPKPDLNAMNLATQAAQAGQKEFVSSQMLLSLLREIDNDDLIPGYVSIFERACDALGRLYMQLLWRTDAFEERFGESQIREFKEMLVSLFQQTGDFICYLRQRDIRPAPVLSLGAISLDKE